MQIFEFHFNPKAKEDHFFETFISEPENIYEKKLGSLYSIGEIENAIPSNVRLLDNIAKVIKARYFTISLKNPEKAISESLKKANEFLAEEVRKENVSWLGNLNFALLSVKEFDLVFTKTGDIKIVLIRGGQVMDIGKNLDTQDMDPYPLKVFFNIVSGKLAINDILLVLTKDVYSYLLKQGTFKKLSLLYPFDPKKLKDILSPELLPRKEETKLTGICFLAVLTEKSLQRQRQILLQKRKPIDVFSPIKKRYKKMKGKIREKLSFFKRIKPKEKKQKRIFISIKKPIIFLKRIKQGIQNIRKSLNIIKKIDIKKIVKKKEIKDKLLLILILMVVLFLGFFIFK